MDFVALDFETANEKRCSPCAIGIVVVKDCKVQERVHWLIRPKEPYFNPYNVFIHGITEHDVRDEPEFPDLWEAIWEYIQGSIVLAHNASFDISVLRHTLMEYNIEFPEFEYSCTRIISKKTWPGLPSYGLQVVSELLGIKFKHHDALEDAFACAEIANRAIVASGATTFDEFASCLDMTIGKMYPGGYTPASSRGQLAMSGSGIQLGEINPRTANFDSQRSLYGQMCVFTGTLRSMKRKEAMQMVVDAGGQILNTVTKHANLLVVGDQDLRQFAEGETNSTKIKKAEALIQKGADLEIISERDFIEMLNH